MLETDGPPPGGAREGPNRALVWLTAAGTAALTLVLALLLGAFGFHVRRYGTHELRLGRLLERRPTLEQVLDAFEAEGTRLTDSPETPEALAAVAARWRDQKRHEILQKGRRWPTTRVFLAGDMVYFVYFDRNGVMKDFTCVSE